MTSIKHRKNGIILSRFFLYQDKNLILFEQRFIVSKEPAIV